VTPDAGTVRSEDVIGLHAIDCMVVIMLENRSFDHMLGYLYSDRGNVSVAGDPFDGLTGAESSLDSDGTPVPVFPIGPDTSNGYFMPGANPGEGYQRTSAQLFGPGAGPEPGTAPMSGFVADFASTLEERARVGAPIAAGTRPQDIMGCFTPEALPVLSALARGFAVCDQWFSSVPSQTLPNRAFAWAATSEGRADDDRTPYTARTIFSALGDAGVSWAVYGYETQPLTRHTFADITDAPGTHFGVFTDFQKAAAAGELPAFVVLEPSWDAAGNSQHPPFDVAAGEHLIHDVYYALRNSPAWERTLLVVTYDEHGGCYDHVVPPANAVPPDSSAGQFGFDFTRFGVRVPTVLISPLIQAGIVFRAPGQGAPLDHTSILSTVEARWGLGPLTMRDAAAQHFGAVLSLTGSRADDPLAKVTPPAAAPTPPGAGEPTYLQLLHASLLAQESQDGDTPTDAGMTSEQVNAYIKERTEASA
jgi:phospholipase C